LLFPTVTFAQTSKHESIWMAMKFFDRESTGREGGELGIGYYERIYEWLLTIIKLLISKSIPPV
jgi:hypothetical protein